MSKPVDIREQRILILAPQRQDAPTLATILRKAGLAPEICSRIAELSQALTAGAGAVLVACWGAWRNSPRGRICRFCF